MVVAAGCSHEDDVFMDVAADILQFGGNNIVGMAVYPLHEDSSETVGYEESVKEYEEGEEQSSHRVSELEVDELVAAKDSEEKDVGEEDD